LSNALRSASDERDAAFESHEGSSVDGEL
jgi:hypothetical protein